MKKPEGGGGMKAYGHFARYYDMFMENVPYDHWVANICELFRQHQKKPELILDLACGTGNITSRLRQKGYDIIGVDQSEDMLAEAKQKDPEILYLRQDMKELELYGTVDAAVCLCDGLNYILDVRDLEKVFHKVHLYMNPGGIFIFDMNTRHYFRNILDGQVFGMTTDDAAYLCENSFDEETGIHTFAATFFLPAAGNGLYRRVEEYHQEKAYEWDMLVDLLNKTGWDMAGVYCADDLTAPGRDSERLLFVCLERSKHE